MRYGMNWLKLIASRVLICFLAIFSFVLSGVLLIVVFGLWFHVYPILKDKNALEDCKKEEEVVAYFKRAPEEVYFRLDQMPYLGWKLPTRQITNKIMVYTRRTGMKYYIYIDGDGNVEYVFSSSS